MRIICNGHIYPIYIYIIVTYKLNNFNQFILSDIVASYIYTIHNINGIPIKQNGNKTKTDENVINQKFAIDKRKK